MRYAVDTSMCILCVSKGANQGDEPVTPFLILLTT